MKLRTQLLLYRASAGAFLCAAMDLKLLNFLALVFGLLLLELAHEAQHHD